MNKNNKNIFSCSDFEINTEKNSIENEENHCKIIHKILKKQGRK